MGYKEEKCIRSGKAIDHQRNALKALKKRVPKKNNWIKEETDNSIIWTNKEMKEVTVEIHHSTYETEDCWGEIIEMDYFHVFLAMHGFPVSDYSEEVTEWPLSQAKRIAERYRNKYDKEGSKILYQN